MTHTKNIKELAIWLDCSQSTVNKLLRIEGNPGKTAKGYPVAAWQKFKNIHKGKNTGRPREVAEGQENLETASDNISDLRRRELEEKVKKLEIDNATKSSQLMPISEVVEIFNTFASEWRKTIESTGLDKIEKDKCFKSLQMATERIGKRYTESQR